MAAETVPGDVIQYSYPNGDPTAEFPEGCAYYMGEYKAVSEGSVAMVDFGFWRSDLTYTVAQVWHGNFYRLDDHLDRLLEGAGRMRLNSPLSRDGLREVMHEMVRRTGLREAYVMIWISRGLPVGNVRSPLQMEAVVGAFTLPYVWVSYPQAQLVGKTAVIARSVQRVSPAAIDPTIKNFSWGDLTRGIFEANDRGSDTAFLLDSDHFLTEGPGFNVCVIKDGELYTPARGILHGVTRKSVLAICDEFGIPTHVEDVPEALVYAADEIFTCTTAGGVMPVRELDGKPISGGKPGPLTMRIRERYWKLMDEPEFTEPVKYTSGL